MELQEMLTVIYKYKKLYERRCSELMVEYDLRMVDLDVLCYIAHSGPKNLAKDITDMGMSKANVSKSVEHLRQKELVALSEDREDRRCIHIQLTPQTEPVIQRVEAVRKELWQQLTQGIESTDREAVMRVMHRLGENMNTEWMKMQEKEGEENG